MLGLGLAVALPVSGLFAMATSPIDDNTDANIVDEVIWVVGDEAILKSDVEVMRLQAAMEGMKWTGDPDCAIPEQIALQKLFMNQAAIDSVEVTESEVAAEIDQQIEFWISQAGSKEKLEEYKKASVTQLRTELHDVVRDRMLAQRMKMKLVEDVTATPSDVRRYFKDLPADSIPFVPTQVEVQILTQTPKIPIEEINRVKDELRDFTERIQSGESSFSTLARLYSEDPGSARRGGELDFAGRTTFDPAFAAVAFNLTDPKKVSKIVESEFGFHIIQLMEKRGDKIKVRHILKTAQVPDEAVDASLARLDSIKTDIVAGKFTFEAGASLISDDKDTRNNNGLMSKMDMTRGTRMSKFEMQDLPAEVAKVVDTMKIGEVSSPFKMINERGKTVCAIVKLKNRIDAHKATITEDFQIMQAVVVAKRKEEKMQQWVADKIKNTYIRVNDRYKDCKFEYEGWIK